MVTKFMLSLPFDVPADLVSRCCFIAAGILSEISERVSSSRENFFLRADVALLNISFLASMPLELNVNLDVYNTIYYCNLDIKRIN